MSGSCLLLTFKDQCPAHTLELILKAEPTVIMLGGPPFYLGGFRVEAAQLEQGLRNLESIVQTVPLVILEHHALRDESWKEKIGESLPASFHGWA